MSKRFLFEAALYVVVMVLTVFFMRSIDAFDRLYEFSRAYESWELDELIAAVPGLLVIMLFYSVRRSLELRKEIMIRKNAQARLREEFQLKKKFMTLVSHEMRTPLDGVIGMLDGMQYFNSEQEREVMRNQASKTAHDLARQLNDVIALARVEQGELYIAEELFDPGKLVQEVVDVVSFKANKYQIGLYQEVSARMPPQVLGYRGHLNQALVNLVDNAVKFTDKGTVRINATFSADKNNEKRGTLVYTIADSGKGIPSDNLDRIFEPYYQEGSEGSRRYPGLGLGLSLVHQLVSLMEGTIDVASEVGKGTTFTLRVPVALLTPLENN